jgi:hypothetical protein
MLAESILDAVAWHAMACWVDVIKSLMHLIPLASPNSTDVVLTSNNAYALHPPVLTVFIAVVTTAACVSVTCVVLVMETKYRKPARRKRTSIEMKTVLNPLPSNVVLPVGSVIPRANVCYRDSRVSSNRRV